MIVFLKRFFPVGLQKQAFKRHFYDSFSPRIGYCFLECQLSRSIKLFYWIFATFFENYLRATMYLTQYSINFQLKWYNKVFLNFKNKVRSLSFLILKYLHKEHESKNVIF